MDLRRVALPRDSTFADVKDGIGIHVARTVFGLCACHVCRNTLGTGLAHKSMQGGKYNG